MVDKDEREWWNSTREWLKVKIPGIVAGTRPVLPGSMAIVRYITSLLYGGRGAPFPHTAAPSLAPMADVASGHLGGVSPSKSSTWTFANSK